jgi:hypothetical protein
MAVRDEQHLKDTRSNRPWRETLGHIPAVLLVGGLLLYGYLSICYDRFYRNLGVDPNDVGLTYAGTLARSSGFVIFCLVLSVPLPFLVAQGLNVWRENPTAKTTRFIIVVIVLIAMVFVFWLARQPWQSAGVAVDKVLQGTPVGPVRYHVQFGHGRLQKIRVTLPILAVRADAASVEPAGKPKDFPALQQFHDDEKLMYLGQSEGTVVLFDARTKTAIYLPASSIVLQVGVLCRDVGC